MLCSRNIFIRILNEQYRSNLAMLVFYYKQYVVIIKLNYILYSIKTVISILKKTFNYEFEEKNEWGTGGVKNSYYNWNFDFTGVLYKIK